MTDSPPTPVKCGFAPVNGLQMYYEIHGDGGVPLLLLHGSLGSLEMFRPLLPALTRSRKVIAVDQQAHGRTADIARWRRQRSSSPAPCGSSRGRERRPSPGRRIVADQDNAPVLPHGVGMEPPIRPASELPRAARPSDAAALQ